MVKIQGITALKKRLAQLEKRATADKDASVVVGFTQNYAIYVHENKEAHHEVGQAKYLEQPARQYQKELGKIVKDAYSKGATLERSLFLAGLRLQREAQQLTPVDTGALRASAFTALEKDLDQIASAAAEKAQAIQARATVKRKAQAEKKAAKKAKDRQKKAAKKAKQKQRKQNRKKRK